MQSTPWLFHVQNADGAVSWVEADACPHKCCRAPELACGKPLELLESVMKEDEVHFNQSMSLAPGLHLTSLLSAWRTGRARLIGNLAEWSAVGRFR